MASCESVDRQRLELEVIQLDKEYREGELTKRGWGKRKAALQLKLLDLDYKEGDLTDQGFEKKKKKLIQQIDDPCTVDSEIKELGDFGSKMPTTLTKLFGRDRQSLKTAATAKPKKEEKFYRYEVYCLPKGATDIPRGNARSFIPKAVIEIRRSDLAVAIRKKIHLLFPEFFSEDEEAQYCYLKATSNKLVKMTSPPSGHQTFNGNALVALCGQGAMYIERNQCVDAMDASQQSQSLTSPSVTVSAPISNSVIAQGLVNFTKTTPPSLPMCTKSGTSSSNPAPVMSSIEMDTLIQELSDPHIGGLILEHADLKSSVQSPGDECESGFTFLYAVNPYVYFFCDWRKMNNKPVLWNKRDYFIKLSKDDLTDFLKFRDAHRLLNTKEELDICVVPVCSIVTQFMNAEGYTFRSVERYGSNYFLVPFHDIFQLGYYVQQLCHDNNIIID